MTNNDMKREVLGNITRILMELNHKINIIEALDNDSASSGFLDLLDQIHTMYKTVDAFEAVITRAMEKNRWRKNLKSGDIVPSEQEKNDV